MNLTVAASRLLTVLSRMTAAERAGATNTDLGVLTGYSSRTITTALGRLETARAVRVRRVAPHPHEHVTGRYIDLWKDGEWR